MSLRSVRFVCNLVAVFSVVMTGMMAWKSHAYEVDAFTHREQIYNDASSNINQITTSLIQKLLTRMNTESGLKSDQCNKDFLRQSLAAALDTNTSDVPWLFTKNAYEQYAKTHPDVVKRMLQLSGGQSSAKSHYAYEKLEADIGRELKLWRQIPLQDPENIYSESDDVMHTTIGAMFAGVSWLCCSPNVSISGHQVGLDKVGHFFENGYDLYLTQKKQGMKEALQFSRDEEEGTWGLWLNGVKSYGDMAANYDGMRFWQWLLDGVDGNAPAISCKKGIYTLNQEFHIEDYASDAWDEAINCSTFSDELAETVLPKILKNTNGKGCPIRLESCVALAKSYPREVAKEILHPRCLNAQRILDALSNSRANSCAYSPEETMISNSTVSFIKALSVGIRRSNLNDAQKIKNQSETLKRGGHE
jgi:hypothetical protein